MRKNIKLLITSLSVLTVALTVTTITVPVVMHYNEINSENSNKNNTIQKAVINTENETAKKILNAGSEEKMKEEVEKVNSDKKWDEVFTFTNENNKSVTNVVDDVIFDLKTTIENQSKKTWAIFAINYKEDFKIANGANIVRHEITLNVDITVTGDAKIDATNALIGLLDGENYVKQKEIFESWKKQSPVELENAIKNKIKFEDSNGEISYDIVVKDIALTLGDFPLTPGTGKIPSIKIDINLNDGFSVNSGNDFLSFETNELGDVAKNIISSDDINDTKTIVETLLNNLLNKRNYAEQKAEYDSWKDGSLPNGLEKSIKDKFKLNGDTIVESVTLNKQDFPKNPGEKISSVEINVKLKDGNIDDADNGLLIISVDNLGESKDNEIKIAEIGTPIGISITSLKESLEGKSYDIQKIIYDGLPTTLPTELKGAIDAAISFNGESVVEEITVKPNGTFPDKADEKIPGVEIEIKLKNGHFVNILGSPVSSTIFPTGPLGITGSKGGITDNDKTNATTTAETLLTGLLSNKIIADQITEYDSWKNALPVGLEDAVKNAMQISGTTVVESITITTGNFDNTLVTGDNIPGVTIGVKLQSGYTDVDGNNEFDLDVSNLGLVGPIAKIEDTQKDDAKTASETLLAGLLSNKIIADQITEYDSWKNNALPVGLEDAVKNAMQISGTTVVESITIATGNFDNTLVTGDNIPGVTIGVKLESGYTDVDGNNEFDLDVSNLGLVGPIAKIEDTQKDDAITVAEVTLLGLLTLEPDFDNQKNQYESWGTTVPSTLVDLIKDVFKIGTTDVVENINIVVGTFPSNPGEKIPDIKMTIKLIDGYVDANGNNSFELTIGNLGDSK